MNLIKITQNIKKKALILFFFGLVDLFILQVYLIEFNFIIFEISNNKIFEKNAFFQILTRHRQGNSAFILRIIKVKLSKVLRNFHYVINLSYKHLHDVVIIIH